MARGWIIWLIMLVPRIGIRRVLRECKSPEPNNQIEVEVDGLMCVCFW